MDLEKYRRLFLEEASDHLMEMSRGLLALEKDATCREALDEVFRMAHSIKGMAASLGYTAIRDLAHRMEDCMQAGRSTGRIDGEHTLPLLFRGLEGLERMVKVVHDTGEAPPPAPELVASLTPKSASSTDNGLKKKQFR